MAKTRLVLFIFVVAFFNCIDGTILFSQQPHFAFRRYSTDEGLSQNVIYTIAQDHRGFLWIGTQDGLNRYDGYNFLWYKHRSQDTASIAGNMIRFIYADRHQRLWLSVYGYGVDVYDRKTGRFLHYQKGDGKSETISTSHVSAIAEDRAGYIWLGHFEGQLDRLTPDGLPRKTFRLPDKDNADHPIMAIHADYSGRLWVANYGRNLYCFNDTTETFRLYTILPEASKNRITTFHSDSSGYLWIGTNDGRLARFNSDRNEIRFYSLKPQGSAVASSVSAILRTTNGYIWAGTTNDGLILLHPEAGAIYRLCHDEFRSHSLSSDQINCLYEDRSGVLWVGTKKGLNKLTPNQMHFYTVVKQAGQRKGLLHSIVLSVYADGDSEQIHSLWMGSPGGGLQRYDTKTDSWMHISSGKSNPSALSANHVFAIVRDRQGYYWIGTSNGLNRYEANTKRWEHYLESSEKTGLSGRFVHSIAEDPDPTLERLWIGTHQGICALDHSDHIIRRYDAQGRLTGEKGTDNITVITAHYLEDKKQTELWVGTDGNGVIRWIPDKGDFRRYRLNETDTHSLSNDFINTICVTQKGDVWVGTQNGINRYIRENETFRRYDAGDGLPNEYIDGILEDRQGYLWISTNRGLCRFEPAGERWVVFSETEGLPSGEFVSGAMFRASNGWLCFGTINGLVYFDPKQIRINNHPPALAVTGFRLFDKNLFLSPPIEETDVLKLNYTDQVFAFEIAALDFIFPAANRYQYRFGDPQARWVDLGNERLISFHYLEPGEYHLGFRAANNHGIWNEKGISLIFRIQPPWWKTNGFKILLLLFLVSLIYGSYRYRIYAIRLQNEKLEQQVKERTQALAQKTELLEQINRMTRAINSEMNFSGLLEAILSQMQTIRGFQRMVFLLPEHNKEIYRLVVRPEIQDESNQVYTASEEELQRDFILSATEIKPDLFVMDSRKKTFRIFQPFGQPASVVFFPIRGQEPLSGYFFFLSDLNVSDLIQSGSLSVIADLKDHLIYAFIKTRLVEDLKILNEKKNEFLGIAAHDLRNPLSSIIGYTDLILALIEEEKFTLEQGVKDLTMISRAAQYMAKLVEDLLDYSAIEAGCVNLQLEKTGLMSVVAECEEFYKRAAQQKFIELRISYFPVLPAVMIDRHRMKEVIENLLSNAIKYTHPGGKIEVYPEIADNTIVLHVQDNGQGLNEDDLQHVFISFKRLSSRPTGGETSTGLGLAIVKKIIELHGGNIWVHSRPGEGATFSFSLPIADSSNEGS